jgi:hypothetical protein
MAYSKNIEGFFVMNAKIILGASAFLFFGLAPVSVVAQVTCTPTYGGGQRCTDNNGNSTTSTPTYGGGYRTTDNNGNTTRTTPTYGGGSRTTDNNGNTRTTTPTYGGGSRSTDNNGNTRTVHGLDIHAVLFEHDVHLFRERLDVLENTSKDFGFLDLIDADIHCIDCIILLFMWFLHIIQFYRRNGTK